MREVTEYDDYKMLSPRWRHGDGRMRIKASDTLRDKAGCLATSLMMFVQTVCLLRIARKLDKRQDETDEVYDRLANDLNQAFHFRSASSDTPEE